MNKYRKKTIVILSIVGILLGIGFAVNWYITNRLEARIAAILVRNVKEATGGFYTFTYDRLSVGLYDGELSISNLHFFPDSTVYESWKKNDSLPREVIDLEFEHIHFKGVNLKMIRKDRDLQFTIFDINEPKVKIVAPLATGKTKKSELTHLDDPYQLIKNHLQTLNVRELNLKNAQVKYIVEDSVQSAIYAIDNTDFSIYNFHLDENSYKNGKLLFSDNISFKINKPQVLLSNDEFKLSIKGLELSTKDSIITINGVKLESIQNAENKQSRELNAELDQIAFHGISLSRINENRILSARNFILDSPQIKMSYHPIPSNEIENNKKDIVVRSASLYEIVSPILAKIKIGTIAINKANFDYTVLDENLTSNYSFSNLNFLAESFLIDSVYISKYNFIHCDEFSLDAKDLKASIAELNYKMNIGSFLFDTKTHFVSLNNISVQPLHARENSISGRISSIKSDQLFFDETSLYSKNTVISKPEVYINIQTSQQKPTTKAKTQPKLGFSVQLSQVKINDGNIKLDVDSNSFYADQLDMAIHQFSLLDRINIADIMFKMNRVGGNFNTSNATFEASNINYNSFDETFNASNLKYNSNSLDFDADQLDITQLYLDKVEEDTISAERIRLLEPRIKNNEFTYNSPKIDVVNFSWIPNKVLIEKLATALPQFKYLSKEVDLAADLRTLTVEGISYINNELTLAKNTINHPAISLKLQKGESKKGEASKVSLEKIKLGEISVYKANLQIENIRSYFDQISNIDVVAKKIEFSPNTQKLDYENISLAIPDMSIPLDNGFYNLNTEKIQAKATKSDIDLEVIGINLKSMYPKFEFAYHHPKNKDWFGLEVGSVKLEGIDINNLKKEKITARNLFVNSTHLENLKNQNIKIQHNLMPMIYEVIQKFPKEFKIDNTKISNFNVTYEEIAKGKETPGKIFFTNMNGRVSNFTNVADRIDQYLDVYANGYLMGTGYFDALWQIPVSPKHDNFNLKAKLTDFDLKELNQLISPMAPVAINSGHVSSVDFSTSASSIGAHIDMTFLYNDLNISLWKEKDDKIKNKGLYSKAVNMLVKKDNLNIGKKPPRIANINVDRDPYHSTFNYFWQILQPAVAESVGVTEKRQNRLMKAGKIFNSIKNFFSPKEKEDSAKEN